MCKKNDYDTASGIFITSLLRNSDVETSRYQTVGVIQNRQSQNGHGHQRQTADVLVRMTNEPVGREAQSQSAATEEEQRATRCAVVHFQVGQGQGFWQFEHRRVFDENAGQNLDGRVHDGDNAE